MSKLGKVELTQKKVYGYTFNYEETVRLDILVETQDQKLQARVDGSGIDVVSDEPSSLLGYCLSWSQVDALMHRKASISSGDDQMYIRDLQEEISGLREENERLAAQLQVPVDNAEGQEQAHAF